MRRRALLALGVVAIAAAIYHGGIRRGGRDARGLGQARHDRRNVPVHRARVELRPDSGRDAGVLQLRQRDRRRTASAASSAARSSSSAVDDGYNPAQHGPEDEGARRAGSRVRARRRARHRAAGGGHRLPEPAEGAADLRLHRRDRVGRTRQARVAPVHDRLAARLPGRGGDLRPVHRRQPAEREDRDHLPERQLRQGLHQRAPGRPRLPQEPDRQPAGLRGHRHLGRRTRSSRCAGPASTRCSSSARRRRRSAPTRRWPRSGGSRTTSS